MRIRYLFLAAAGAVMVAACGDTTEPRVPTSVEVDQATVALEDGGSALVVARVLDQHGRAFDTPPEGFAITWSTSDAGVATVDEGEIMAVWQGSATISAVAGELAPAAVQVTVGPRTVEMQMAFDFSGHRSGSFSIEETFPVDQMDWLGDFALTFRNAEFGEQDIMGQRLRDDGLLDFLYFWAAGHVDEPGTGQLRGGFLLLGYDVNTDTAEDSYNVIAGSVTFTSVTSQQVAGTFALSLEEVVGEGETAGDLEITGGAFDAPLVPESFVFGDPAVAALGGSGSMALPEPRLEGRRGQR